MRSADTVWSAVHDPEAGIDQGTGRTSRRADCDQSKPTPGATYAQTAVVPLRCGQRVGAAGPLWTTTVDDWAWTLGVNLMGVVHGIRSFTPIAGANILPDVQTMANALPGELARLEAAYGLGA